MTVVQRQITASDRIHGSLLGGALGDALGAPVEFIRSLEQIHAAFGPDGITDLAPAYGRVGGRCGDSS